MALGNTTMTFNTPQTRWRAVTQRDKTAHYSFFYGVTSTKVYCRPTCTARVARRANVVFYDGVAEARKDGFRPCVRCKPDDEYFMGDQEELVGRTLALLQTRTGNLAMQGGVKQLSKDIGVTPSYLCRVFKKVMGVTVGQYIADFEANTDSTVTTMASCIATESLTSPITATPSLDGDKWVGFWTNEMLESSDHTGELYSLGELSPPAPALNDKANFCFPNTIPEPSDVDIMFPCYDSFTLPQSSNVPSSSDPTFDKQQPMSVPSLYHPAALTSGWSQSPDDSTAAMETSWDQSQDLQILASDSSWSWPQNYYTDTWGLELPAPI
jgi:methylphosphotriester-DNA--protein-cysteine methyltransferase